MIRLHNRILLVNQIISWLTFVIPHSLIFSTANMSSIINFQQSIRYEVSLDKRNILAKLCDWKFVCRSRLSLWASVNLSPEKKSILELGAKIKFLRVKRSARMKNSQARLLPNRIQSRQLLTILYQIPVLLLASGSIYWKVTGIRLHKRTKSLFTSRRQLYSQT